MYLWHKSLSLQVAGGSVAVTVRRIKGAKDGISLRWKLSCSRSEKEKQLRSIFPGGGGSVAVAVKSAENDISLGCSN